MIQPVRYAYAFLIALPLASCANVQPTAPAYAEAAPSVSEVRFSQLSDTVWMHASFENISGFGLVRSNGLIVIDDENSMLVDTAWNDDQTKQIVEYAKSVLKRPVKMAVLTHAHSDKMGGVGALNAIGVKTYALDVSNRIAPSKGLTPATNDLVLKEGEATTLGPIEIFYPGAGHTVDNIVVNIPTAGILFGGCLIRPGDTDNLGNTADGDVAHWGKAVADTGAQFPISNIVVPSHGMPEGRELLAKTVQLAAAPLP